MMKSVKIALWAALAVLATAPLASVTRADTVQPAAVSYDASRLEVIFVNRTTERRIAFGTPSFRMVGSMPLLEVEVRNPTSGDRRFQYLAEWFAEDGTKAQVSAVWQDLFLVPNQRDTLRVMSQLPQAYRARVTIREVSKKK